MGPSADGEPVRSIMPNAGLPQRLEGRFVYAASPAYFGTVTPRLLAAGARIIGGCCGTTPEHIAAMRSALDALDAAAVAAAPTQTADRPTEGSIGRPRPSILERVPGPAAPGEAPPPTPLPHALAARPLRRS